jgi:hypothetical protein
VQRLRGIADVSLSPNPIHRICIGARVLVLFIVVGIVNLATHTSSGEGTLCVPLH